MEIKKLSFSLIVLLSLLSSFPLSAFARDAGQTAKTLLAATSPFEDLVDSALAVDNAGIKKALAAADGRAAAVKAALPDAAAAHFDQMLQAIHQAASDKKYQEVAVTAVEAFRFLLDEIQPGNLKVPREVYLLDYAGFKIRVLAATAPPDWKTMRQTAEHASLWWDAVASNMSDKALQDAVSTAVGGLIEATKKEDMPMLQYAVQIEMDLVDLLENYFEQKQ